MPFTFPPTIYSEYPTNAPAILSIVAGKDGNVSFSKRLFAKIKENIRQAMGCCSSSNTN